MENKYEYVTKNGLHVIYVYKPAFTKSYCGIGTNYGGANIHFTVNQKEVTSPLGIAHFIEHKLFAMPDGSDAFQTFSDINATANAYTSNDKTLYFFSTNEDILEPLDLLLDMYTTPYFDKDEVEREKSIIISEINMYADRPDARFDEKILKALYPGDDYSTPIAGTKESVQKTTVEDMKTAYEAFYTPENSFLVIVSHIDKTILFEHLEERLKDWKSSNQEVLPKKDVLSHKPSGNVLHKDIVQQSQAVVGLRINATIQNDIFCNYMIGIFDCIFSPLAPFYEDLRVKKAFVADIDYIVTTSKHTSYAIISATSNHPEEFVATVQEKLKNLSEADLDEEILELYLRHLKAESIAKLDSIEYLGDEILSLALEGTSYFEELEKIKNISIHDFKHYLSYITGAEMITAICKKK